MDTSSEDGDRLVGQVIADRYHIMEVIGEGGMGRVYLAEHVRMGRKSAVKVMSPNMALSADAITRFNREAANAARINHPNVAQIYDFGETSDGVLYLAMEFVEGDTLRNVIAREGPLPATRAAALTKQIADALAAAHHLGIVHRDLKPDNIMIARHHDGSDWVKVVDFGIAKTVQGSGDPGAGSQTVTTAGVSLGTPEYMSPEQLAGERLDSRTDLYSLGLVLFNMLTGDLPYPKLTSRETLVRRLTSKPHTLAEVAPNTVWPAALQDALDRALAPEARDRYESVTDFARDVSHAVAAFDAAATTRVPSKTARLSGPTMRIERPESAEPKAAVVGKRSSYRSSLIAAALVLVVVGGADAAYMSYRHGKKAPPPIQVASNAPTVTPQAAPAPVDTVTHVAAAPPEKKKEPARETKRDTKRDTKRETKRDTVVPQPVAQPAPAPRDTMPPPVVESPTVNPTSAKRVAHNWLRANGDSGAARMLGPNATDGDRIRLLGEEIRGHVTRANQFMMQGDVQKTRSELRDVAGESQMFRMLFPAAADSIHLDQLMRGAGMRIIQVCQSVVADTTKKFPPTFTCQQLVPPAMRGARQGRGNRQVP